MRNLEQQKEEDVVVDFLVYASWEYAVRYPDARAQHGLQSVSTQWRICQRLQYDDTPVLLSATTFPLLQ